MAKKQTLRLDLVAKNFTKSAFTGVNRGLNRIKRTATRATAAIGRNMRGFQNQAAALIGILGGFQALVKGPAEFGKEMAKVGTLGEEARSRLAGFTDEVRDLAVESGIGPNELADGLFNVISAGTEASRAMEVLKASTKLAVAGSADLTSVVSGLSVVANSFNVQTTEGFKELSQNLFAAQVIGKTTIEDLSANVGKLGATFADSSIDVTQMFTALADITTVSSNTEEAATSLRAAITAILKPSDKLRRVMEDVGIPLGAAAFQGRNLGEIFSAISKRSKELNIPLAQVIGNVRAVTAAVTLGAENGERYNRALEKQQGFLGELDSSYTLMSETLDHTLSRFTSLLKILAQDFSSTAFGDLNKTLTEAVSNVETLRIKAKMLGLDIKEAFLVVQPVITVVIESVAFMVNSFRISFQAIRSIIVQGANAFEGFLDTLKTVPFVQDLFTSRIDEFNKNMKETISRRKPLIDELAKVNVDLANAMHTVDLVERARRTGSGADEVASARAFDPKQIGNLQAQKAQLEGRLSTIRLEMNRLISTGEALTQEGFASIGGIGLGEDGFLGLTGSNDAEYDLVAREAIRNLENAINRHDSDTIFAELIGNIKENLKKISSSVIDGADDGELKALQSHREKLGRELQKLGEGPAKNAVEEIVTEIGKVEEALNGAIDTESTLTWLDSFKEKSKAAWGAFKDGVMAAIKPVKNLEEKMKELGERLVQIAQSSLARFFDEIAAGTANSEEAFKRFTRTVLSEINRLMSEAIVRQFVTMIAGAFSGSTSVGGTAPQHYSTTPLSPDLTPMSTGGIVTGPTAAMIGEGGQNEAVVPLPNGRSIPVQFSKGNAGGDNITININAVDGPSVERMLSSSSGRRAIEGVMRNAKATRRDLR